MHAYFYLIHTYVENFYIENILEYRGSLQFVVFRIRDPHYFVIQFQALISRIPYHFMIFKKKSKKISKKFQIFFLTFTSDWRDWYPFFIVAFFPKKMDFWKVLDQIWGFTLKTVPGIHDPRISWLPVGTENHKMREPPV